LLHQQLQKFGEWPRKPLESWRRRATNDRAVSYLALIKDVEVHRDKSQWAARETTQRPSWSPVRLRDRGCRCTVEGVIEVHPSVAWAGPFAGAPAQLLL
jgi:hypothetical protein